MTHASTPGSDRNPERLLAGMQTILAITRKMAGSLDHSSILQEICIASRDMLDANDTTIMGLDETQQLLKPLYTDDLTYTESLMNFRLPVGQGLTGHVVATGKAEIVNDPARSTLVIQVPGTPEEIQEVLMSVPLMQGGKPIGAITVTRPLDRPFGELDLELLLILAGQATAMLGSARLLEDLARSEESFRSLVENAEVGLFRLDLEGRLLWINPYIRELLHLGSGLPESRLIWGGEAAHREFIAKLNRQQKVVDQHCRTMTSDGTIRDLAISAKRFADLGYIEGVIRDISARTRLEYENQARLLLLESLINNLPLALVMRDPEGHVLGDNPAFHKLFVDNDAGTGQERFNNMLHTLPDLSALLKEGLRGKGGSIEEMEIPAHYMNGQQPGFFNISCVPITNPEGVTTEIVMLFEDIGERRALRNQLIQSQKMESVGSLAGGIAHDFSAILGGIMSNTAFLQDKHAADKESSEHLSVIERAVSRAGQLTRQLLGFARQAPEQQEELAVDAVIDRTLELFQRSIRPNIHLQREGDSSLPPLLGDTMKLEQMLLNLLLNAVDAIDGEGAITLKSRERLLDDHEAEALELKAGRYIELDVQDTGSGILEADLSRVFDPFFSTKGPGKGTGLGLTMVYNIVESHRGHVEIKSRRGFGTRVRVLLPQAPSHAGEEGAEGSGSLIWVVDDDKVLRDMLRRILESQGYRVATWDSGENALSQLRKTQEVPELWIVDMLMRGMSGLETREEILKILPDSRLLFCSGYTTHQKGELLNLPGVRGFIEKPFTLSSLNTLVKRALEA